MVNISCEEPLEGQELLFGFDKDNITCEETLEDVKKVNHFIIHHPSLISSAY